MVDAIDRGVTQVTRQEVISLFEPNGKGNDMKHSNGTKEIEINGQKFTAQYTIEVGDDPIDFETLTDGMDEQVVKELARDLERGDCSIVMITCTAKLECFSGADHLGGVFYYRSSDIDDTIASHGMIENACSNLIENAQKRLNSLKRIIDSISQ